MVRNAKCMPSLPTLPYLSYSADTPSPSLAQPHPRQEPLPGHPFAQNAVSPTLAITTAPSPSPLLICGEEYLNSASPCGRQCEADFPAELEQLESTLSRVLEYQSVRERLTAEMADYSGIIRSLVVRAEDARLLADMLV